MKNSQLFLIPLLISASGLVFGAAKCSGNSTPLNTSSLIISEPLTVSEIEAKELHTIEVAGKALSQPFGYEFKEWLSFKAQIQKNDQIVGFKPLPNAFGGEEGYYLVRKGCVVSALTTLIIN